MAHPEDKALLERLRAGEESAFEELVRTHGGHLLAVARRYLPEDDALDAVQDAFLSAFRALDRFEGEARLSTWLHRIAVNASLMKLRSRRRRPEQPIEELLPDFDETGHLRSPTSPWRELPDDPAERRELVDRVRAAIGRLPESYRNVLMLRDIEELDTREVAARLGLSASAVKTRLHRARQALRGLLDSDLRSEA